MAARRANQDQHNILRVDKSLGIYVHSTEGLGSAGALRHLGGRATHG